MKRIAKNLVFLLALFLPFATYTQTVYEVKSHSIVVEGTSNLHDWSAEVENVKGVFRIKVEEGKIKDIENLSVKIDAKSLKSSKGSIMDSKITEALNTKKHPEISFTLSRVNSITENPGNYRINTTGELNISGVSKPVTLNAVGRFKSAGEIEFEGTTKVKMTDFNVAPPKAMFGALTTGDEVTLKYKVVIKPQLLSDN